MLSLKRGAMKKKLMILFLAILVGAILSIPALSLKKGAKITKTNMYVLQLGVYKNYDNALEKKGELEGSVIYKKGDNYYVLAGISKEVENLSFMEECLKTKDIPYYKKQMNILYDEDTYDKYVLLLKKIKDEDSLKKVNEKLLKVVMKDES